MDTAVDDKRSGNTSAIMKQTKSMMSGTDSETAAAAAVEVARCECCGLMEECTPAYIGRVCERFQGRWICGLCAEAVEDETRRDNDDMITTDEALSRHMKFCQQFKSSSPPTHDPTKDLISAVKHLLRRSLDSPRSRNRSNKTCFCTLSNLQN